MTNDVTNDVADNVTEDILETLNPVQKQAVLYLDSPLLIIAGAGSGKTKVITNKIAYLVREKDYNPRNILGVTFTNKAASEMRNRIQQLTGIDARSFNIFTFHALGLRILRQSSDISGFDREWEVMDDSDQKKILNNIIKNNFNHYTSDMRDSIKRKIGFAKMNLIYPNNKDYLYQKGFNDDEVEIFSLYFKYQGANKVWDYEDLVSLPAKLLQGNKELLEKYRSRFRYVVVDEFQDTNPNQYELIRLLAGDHKNITIVGDDDQAIYSWRGASIRFLFNFEEDFPRTHIVKLEQNYRSTPQVLDFANDMITRNRQRRGKAMWTDREDGNPVYVLNSSSKDTEARMAAEYITRLKHEDPELFPVAILYRINSQSLAFETEFAQQGIDFKILKGQRFFDRKEVKDSLALLRLAVKPDDDISFARVVDFLSLGIGAKTLQNLTEVAGEHNLSLFQALREHMPDRFSSKDIFPAIYALSQKQTELKFSEILEKLLRRSHYLDNLEARGEESRVLNVRELIEFIKKWEDENPGEPFTHLVDRISLDSGDSDSGKEKENKTPVFLLTMHNAKGLEFNTVIVAGSNNTFMPFFMRKDRTEIEEERRLFYVAATRAIRQLIVSTGAEKPSRFIDEINSVLYSRVYSIDPIFHVPLYQESVEIPESGIMQTVHEEKYLEHPIFGRGKILNNIDGEKVLVDFPKKGEKVIDTSVVAVTFL